MTKVLRLGSFSILFLITLGCTTISGTNKHAFLITSPQEEARMGISAYREILNKEKESTNRRAQKILERVGNRIAQVAEARHQLGFKWEFKLIESTQPNAFCLPGGKVAVYTGILKVMQNEAALAVVLGHEVAHATLRHGGQRIAQNMAVTGLVTGAALAGGFIKDTNTRRVAISALGAGATVGLILPFSRSNESEADSFGLEYAAAAGYDPSEALNFWKRMSESGGNKAPEFLSTHPADASRIRNIEALLRNVEPLYLNSPRYGLGEKL
jgi:metalloendopeptidase OMA1, mitochondrial